MAKLNNPSITFEKNLRSLNSRVLADFLSKGIRAVGLRGTVSVLITSNAGIRKLNARFRGKKKATDVLSFPAAASAHGFAGDIAISLDIATQNASLLGHSVSDEIRILILHGVLHLAGYDHETDQGEMAKKEIALRKRFALPSGLIERGSPVSARKKSAKGPPIPARSRR
jgi:probable rRNA maturation factor